MRRRKRYMDNDEDTMQSQMVWFATGIAAVCILMILTVTVCQVGRMQKQLRESAAPSETKEAVAEIPAASETVPGAADTPKPTENPEKKVYTYLQGPKSWKKKIDWSGEWGEAYLDGGYFGAFGCGLCCMANIYSSQTPYRCSPLDMYGYAKQETAYAGGMAIEWGYMRRTLTALGFDCEVKRKEDTYEKFANSVRSAECCIVLVSSNDSDVYWKDTPGHYVTVFLYNKKKDTIFLADSGNPNHNRQTVSLKKIYRSLKTRSNWQYLRVDKYHGKKDSWKHKGTEGSWVKPEYYRAE